MSNQRLAVKFKRSKIGTVSFDENTTKKLEIPRVNAIRKLIMRIFVEAVEDNTADPTEEAHSILNIIKKIRLVMDGDENKFNIDGMSWYFAEKYAKGSNPFTNKDDDHLQNTTKTWEVQLTADFASNRLEDNDISALLPAGKFSKLDLEFDWGDKDDIYSALASGITTTDANSGVTVEFVEAFLDPAVHNGEDIKKFVKGTLVPFIDFRETTSVSPNLAAGKDNFEDAFVEDEIHPVPAIIYVHLLQAFAVTSDQKGNDLSDSVVTDIKVLDTRGDGDNKVTSNWTILHQEAKIERSLETIEAGVAYLDYIDILGNGLTNVDTDDTQKLRILSGATGSLRKYSKYVVARAQ